MVQPGLDDGRPDSLKVIEIPEEGRSAQAVVLKQLVQLRHPLRLPARERHVVLLREGHDVVRHLLRVLLDLRRLVVQRKRQELISGGKIRM